MLFIYSPSEDSHLLSNILKKQLPVLLEDNPKLIFLEIGTGSGIHLETVLSLGVKKENIFSCDIDKKAVDHCNHLGFHCIKSNLFENIIGKFDLIIFNPPYLPEGKFDKEKDTTGGKTGKETIIKFLKQAKKHLKEKGRIFLLVSSHTNKINFKGFGYKENFLGNERLFFEELCVWELIPEDLKKLPYNQ